MYSKDSQAELVERTLSSFEERFGIPKDYFRSCHLFARKNDVWCCSRQAGKVQLPEIVRRGLRIARVFEYTIRPTTNAVQLFGHMVKRSRVELDERQTRLFLAGKTQEIKVSEGVTDGFVVAFHKDFALGIGLLKGKKLKSQVPRSRRVIG